MRVWSLGQEDPLKKEIAVHSSILARRIPWTEEPGELWSIGSQRVGRDSSNFMNSRTSFKSRVFSGWEQRENQRYLRCGRGSTWRRFFITEIYGHRAPGEGNGNPLQYSCLGNLMDRVAWWVTVHGVAKETQFIC